MERQLPVDHNSVSCAAQYHVGDGGHPCSNLWWLFDPVVRISGVQWKSNESTKHYRTQMLVAINWRKSDIFVTDLVTVTSWTYKQNNMIPDGRSSEPHIGSMNPNQHSLNSLITRPGHLFLFLMKPRTGTAFCRTAAYVLSIMDSTKGYELYL